MAILFDPRFWLAAVLWTAATAFLAYHKGGKDERAERDAQQLVAERQARDTEQELRRYENRATAAYIDRLHKHQERANALPKIVIPADCAVPADAGRVLNDAQRMPGDAGAGSGPGEAAAAVDSTCAAELEIAKRNYADVCTPNAEQLIEVQRRWEDVRRLLNSGRREDPS